MPPPPTLPHGTWPSPLTASALARGTLRLSSPVVTPSGAVALARGGLAPPSHSAGGAEPSEGSAVYWLEGRPSEGGRAVLCRQAPGGQPVDLTPAPYDVRSKVHEYGGAAFTVRGEEIFFVNASDQAVHRLRPGQAPAKLTEGAPRWRFADLAVDPVRARLVAVAERRTAPDAVPENLVVALDLGSGAIEVLVAGADFYASPTVSGDGQRLAWLSWDHPHMPWDAATLHLAQLDADGRPGQVRPIAGSPAASAQQPLFAADGTLYFLLEREGYWNLHRWPGAGGDQDRPSVVAAMPAELGVPLWGLGTRTWDLLDGQTAVAVAIEQGLTRLVLIDLATGAQQAVSTDLETDLVAVGHLSCHAGRLAILGGFPDRSSGLVLLDLTAAGQRARATTLREYLNLTLDPAFISRAEPITFATTDGDRAHGFFYPPHHPQAVAAAGALPPLVVCVHGGPTGATSAAFNPLVQFFTTRGLAVLDVNYRGSTGYGRPYRDRLQDRWGIYDVEDCLAGARALALAGKVDPGRMAIRGSSAGGYTVLAALVHPEGHLFSAGACLYGVSDLGALARDTHKFESRYLDGLVGKWPERAEVYAQRSPINHADALRVPVIFFQGLDDKVVPPDQTRRLADALERKGIAAPYHAFAGESHGFRREETLRAVYQAEIEFYGRVFGF
jgi:dipeptidyl aminopeptidase/acylaminoacyl peptidase